MATSRVSAPATHSTLPPFWTAGELAVKPREFSAFQWACGFAETLSVIPPRTVEEHGTPEAKEDSAGSGGPGGGSPSPSSSSAPALPTLKFRGWEKGPRNSPGNARRVAKALSGVIPESTKIHFFSMGRGAEEEEDSEFDSPAVSFDFPGFGFISASLDIVLVKTTGSVRRPPPHSGLTMLDDAVAVIECDSSEHLSFDSGSPGISRRHLRQLYTKTVLIHLLREKPLPVYLTDFESGAVKASVVSGPRGVPLVIYERLTNEGFVKELQHGQRKPALTAKTMSAVRRFKYGWCLSETRTRPPFALDGREAKKASEGKGVPAGVDAQLNSAVSPSASTGGEKVKMAPGTSGSKKVSSTATTAASPAPSFSSMSQTYPSQMQSDLPLGSHNTPTNAEGRGGELPSPSMPTTAAAPAASITAVTPKKRTRKPRDVSSSAAAASAGAIAPAAAGGSGPEGVSGPGGVGPGNVKMTAKGEKGLNNSTAASGSTGGNKKQKVVATGDSPGVVSQAATLGGVESMRGVGDGGGGVNLGMKGKGVNSVVMQEQHQRGRAGEIKTFSGDDSDDTSDSSTDDDSDRVAGGYAAVRMPKVPAAAVSSKSAKGVNSMNGGGGIPPHAIHRNSLGVGMHESDTSDSDDSSDED
ncbi:nuclear factor nf4 [Cystoisospora suis]|uniref:Nuclear factor nf4 n=1 Tax=Cystoisospora suis TaxID=483139 RepID=A0A2C6L8N6_9APIC|nr:nuclear factor nf4 [Cystoisospora suis]